jgi:hypothetical protein
VGYQVAIKTNEAISMSIPQKINLQVMDEFWFRKLGRKEQKSPGYPKVKMTEDIQGISRRLSIAPGKIGRHAPNTNTALLSEMTWIG